MKFAPLAKAALLFGIAFARASQRAGREGFFGYRFLGGVVIRLFGFQGGGGAGVSVASRSQFGRPA